MRDKEGQIHKTMGKRLRAILFSEDETNNVTVQFSDLSEVKGTILAPFIEAITTEHPKCEATINCTGGLRIIFNFKEQDA